MEEKRDSLHNNLIVLYIIIVVILTVFATWVVLTRAMPVQAGESSSTTPGATTDDYGAKQLHTSTGATVLDVNEDGKNEFRK